MAQHPPHMYTDGVSRDTMPVKADSNTRLLCVSPARQDAAAWSVGVRDHEHRLIVIISRC